MVGVSIWLLKMIWRGFALVLRAMSLLIYRSLSTLLSWCKAKPDTHGTACFAERPQLRQIGSKAGLITGRIGRKYLRFDKAGYMLVIAKTRAGKGAGIVIPNLLTYSGSCIVNDIKGENAAVTARRRATFGAVHRLDLDQPFVSARFNPLDLVRYGTVHQTDDALEISKLLHTRDFNSDSHWNEQSAAGIAALMLHVLERHQSQPALQTLAQVRALVAQTELVFLDLMEDMASRSLIGFVRETAAEFLSMNGSPEMKSIRSTMSKATRLWSAGSPITYVTNRSDFDLATFNQSPQTLYISVPEDKLAIYGRFLRLVQGCALMALTRAARHEPPPTHPTLFVLDEAAAMGYLQPVEQAAGYIAAYAKMILVFQDLDQLEKTYPKARSLIANAGCLVAFGVNDFETAALLSKNLGNRTVATTSQGQSQAWDDLIATRHNLGHSTTGRPLLDPSEILRLPQHQCLVFMRDVLAEPILADKVRYWRERLFKGQFDLWRGQPAHAHGDASHALAAPAVADVAALLGHGSDGQPSSRSQPAALPASPASGDQPAEPARQTLHGSHAASESEDALTDQAA